jgi:glycosyltransferase involved in cell wall biosynthesis
MIRICTSLDQAGYEVLLVGRMNRHSGPLAERPYQQHRLNLPFFAGKGFYVSYQIALFHFLMKQKADAVVAIDLDTIIPVYHASKIRGWKIAMDAHEYFTGQKEVMSRPAIHKIWKGIEKKYLHHFQMGYTVSNGIARLFREEYGLNYEVIRNTPVYKVHKPKAWKENMDVIYRGALNEARGLAELIDAMPAIHANVHLYGEGNYTRQLKEKIAKNNLQNKLFIHGAVLPAQLDEVSLKAGIGINLVENTGLNQYHSLANKFFDLMHLGIPQVTMNFPEYRTINEKYEVALLIDQTYPELIAGAVNRLLNNKDLYEQLSRNAIEAARIYCWENEEPLLLKFYERLVG